METEEGVRKRRGRPKLMWKDSVKRDLEKAGVNSREWEKNGRRLRMTETSGQRAENN